MVQTLSQPYHRHAPDSESIACYPALFKIFLECEKKVI